ncbi:MAG: HAD-IC family P-type ATPase, partial [Chloroflexota bacterium]
LGLFFGQFKNFLIIILLLAVLISALLGEVVDASLIFVIVLFAAGLGFVQEYRAERALEALRKMTTPTATVLRRGQERDVPSPDVVPGDVVLLSTGDRVPADCRLIQVVNLKVDEASLTGESGAVEKILGSLPGPNIPVGDRRNMAYMGTSVVYGRGRGMVVATGMTTQFGRIAKMLQEIEEPRTPLQLNLDRMGRLIAQIALGLAALFLIAGLVRGYGFFEMFLWAVSLAVAVVPEALPAVVTISLALGVQKLARRHALIRRLPAVETLGSTSVICSDKTGTLTQDQMTVRKLYVNGSLVEVSGGGYEPRGNFSLDGQPFPVADPHLQLLLRVGALCNDSRLISDNGGWQIKGDPTEAALLVAAAKAGIGDELRSQSPRLGEIPFSSETKRMTTLHQAPQGRVAYAKGATEVILESCSHVFLQGREVPLTVEGKESILQANSE